MRSSEVKETLVVPVAYGWHPGILFLNFSVKLLGQLTPAPCNSVLKYSIVDLFLFPHDSGEIFFLKYNGGVVV